jgi:hypothetical protein
MIVTRNQAAVDAVLAARAAAAQAELIESYRRAVQAHVDATARARGYDSGVSAASYAGDPNAVWAAEAAAFIAWRSAVWVLVFDMLAEVQAGDADAPESPDALIATLPAMVWPA